MANNRMFLVHVPTGLAASLGKRIGWGWCTVDSVAVGDGIEQLYDTLERYYGYAGEQDAFAIAMEDAEGASLAICQWKYTFEQRADGLIQLQMNDAPIRTPSKSHQT